MRYISYVNKCNQGIIKENIHIKQQEDTPVLYGEENGHQWIDLGLPSGTLWATMNIGAETETDYGDQFQYGKTTPWATSNATSPIYSGTENPLSLSADAAHVNWGENWHLPTEDQLQELYDNTTQTVETNFNDSGIDGLKLTAQNGQYIFFPFTGYSYGELDEENFEHFTVRGGEGDYGYYLSSTPSIYAASYTGMKVNKNNLSSPSFGVNYVSIDYVYDRTDGHSARAVVDPQP